MKADIHAVVATVTLFTFLSLAHAVSDVTIYLYPNIEYGDREIKIGDLGTVEGDESRLEAVSRIAIDPRFYEDGLIDRSEIRQILREHSEESACIFGNAVRIQAKRVRERGSVSADPVSDRNVKSGDTVNILIIRNGISLQIPATALEDGKKGEMVRMRLKNAREVRGRVSTRGDVEVWM